MQAVTQPTQDSNFEEEQQAHRESVRGNVPAESVYFMVGDEYLTASSGWDYVPEAFFGMPVPPGFTLRRVLRF